DVVARAIPAAHSNLHDFKSQFGIHDNRLINLAMRVEDRSRQAISTFNRSALLDIIKTTRRIIIQASGGAGKTVTLAQLAQALFNEPQGYIPILASMSEWAVWGNDFIRCAANQIGLTTENLLTLKGTGRLVFLLNGWNEIPEAKLDQTSVFLKDLLAKFRDSCFVIATRQREIQPPIPNAIILHIEPLSDDQRLQVIQQYGFSDSERIIGDIEAIPTVENLTRLPLFLSTVLSIVERGENIPTSRS